MESPGIAPAPAYAMEPPQKSGALKRRPGTQWVFYVCRLPMSEPEIRGFMAQAEGLLSVDVLTDDAGYPTGFGYAQYRTPDLCARAIEALSGTEIASSITIQLRPSPGPPAARAAKDSKFPPTAIGCVEPRPPKPCTPSAAVVALSKAEMTRELFHAVTKVPSDLDYMAQLIVAKADLDASPADRMGGTPLMLAVRAGQPDAVELLLQYGAKVQLQNQSV